MVKTPGVNPGACRKAPKGKPFVSEVTIPGSGTSILSGLGETQAELIVEVGGDQQVIAVEISADQADGGKRINFARG